MCFLGPIGRAFSVLVGLYVSCLLRQLDCFDFQQPNRISKRFEDSVWSEGLPLWLEKRSITDDAEPFYSDSLDPMMESPSPLELQISQGMEQRKEKLLNRLARALQGEAVPYEDQLRQASSEQISMPVRRAAPTGIGQLGGFRSYGYWQPITLGVVGSVVVVAVAIGAVAYHQKTQFQKKRAHEAEFGSLLSKRSPVESLLGEATVTSLEGDRKLAHSAQMYHYQHQKQQMLAVDRASDPTQVSEDGSESDVEEGDFTVYECPGLAEAEQLEVQNPLFEGGESIAQGPSTNGSCGEIVNPSDLDDGSDSTPTVKTTGQL
ncbi:hypothetical protein EG68_02365 [Paragonimus skrjabini miyazakii]|uniref:Neural proliferation differentiation and control protein 1 n=1 Tax=Paragonimus skrjabini miyazakii TaxID=59628 RepID=A0A8S9Z4R4_9TREM|nr:hypothetical protein EG68_02365 [Paragonimus skrjabini miyazakii]